MRAQPDLSHWNFNQVVFETIVCEGLLLHENVAFGVGQPSGERACATPLMQPTS